MTDIFCISPRWRVFADEMYCWLHDECTMSRQWYWSW